MYYNPRLNRTDEAAFPEKFSAAKFENLTGYSTGNADCCVRLPDNVPAANGPGPVCADLTIPIAGFGSATDFNRFSRISPGFLRIAAKIPLHCDRRT